MQYRAPTSSSRRYHNDDNDESNSHSYNSSHNSSNEDDSHSGSRDHNENARNDNSSSYGNSDEYDNNKNDYHDDDDVRVYGEEDPEIIIDSRRDDSSHVVDKEYDPDYVPPQKDDDDYDRHYDNDDSYVDDVDDDQYRDEYDPVDPEQPMEDGNKHRNGQQRGRPRWMLPLILLLLLFVVAMATEIIVYFVVLDGSTSFNDNDYNNNNNVFEDGSTTNATTTSTLATTTTAATTAATPTTTTSSTPDLTNGLLTTQQLEIRVGEFRLSIVNNASTVPEEDWMTTMEEIQQWEMATSDFVTDFWQSQYSVNLLDPVVTNLLNQSYGAASISIHKNGTHSTYHVFLEFTQTIRYPWPLPSDVGSILSQYEDAPERALVLFPFRHSESANLYLEQVLWNQTGAAVIDKNTTSLEELVLEVRVSNSSTTSEPTVVAPTTTISIEPPEEETSAPAPAPQSWNASCPVDMVPIVVSPAFDFNPQEVGIVLIRSGPEDLVWTFESGSFAAPFVQDNENGDAWVAPTMVFSICVVPTFDYRMLVLDSASDGFIAKSSSRTVHGQFLITYDFQLVAYYNAKCDSGDPDVTECGEFCRCEFEFGGGVVGTVGGCTTSCPYGAVQETERTEIIPVGGEMQCYENEILLELQMTLETDISPHFGVFLADSAGNAVLDLPAGSFGTSDLLPQTFALCLPSLSEESYSITISDTSGNGMLAASGTFAINYNLDHVASYQGDCLNADNDVECGPFCACTYILDAMNGSSGSCQTDC